MLLSVRLPPGNERSPKFADQAIRAIGSALSRHARVTLMLGSNEETVGLYVQCSHHLAATVSRQITAAYPDARVDAPPDSDTLPSHDHAEFTCGLRLRPDVFSIVTYHDFEDRIKRAVTDPITGILQTLTPRKGLRPRLEIVLRPASTCRCFIAKRIAAKLQRPFFLAHPSFAMLLAHGLTHGFLAVRAICFAALSLLPKRGRAAGRALEASLKAAGEKCEDTLFEVSLLISVTAPKEKRRQVEGKIHEIAASLAQFSPSRHVHFHLARIHLSRRRLRLRRGFLMSPTEIATLWHPPTELSRAESMAISQWRELEPPPDVPSKGRHPEVAVLGRTCFRGRRDVFGILPDDRRRHLFIIGKTGMGKSTLLQSLTQADIEAGRGVALIDPHGDLAESVLEAVPKRRTNDVILFDAGDRDYPIAFNPLSCTRVSDRPLVASGVVSAFKKLFADSWGPRLEHILRNALLALLETPDATLLSVLKILSNAGYRKSIVAKLEDPLVRSFWTDEFAAWNPRYRLEAIAPIQNKVEQFLSSPILRGIVSQPSSAFDLRRIMDDGKILIVNLSKGRIGEDASALLGAFLVTGIQQAAMSRAEIPEDDRRDFFIYVDEFQNFATESFAMILSEARKYRLNLTIANQYLAQMEEATMDAVFGNVGSMLCFQVGARDAEMLAEQLTGDVTVRDLIALPKYHAYLRLLIDGMPSRPFSLSTLPPTASGGRQGRGETIRNVSRKRYATASGQGGGVFDLRRPKS